MSDLELVAAFTGSFLAAWGVCYGSVKMVDFFKRVSR